MTPYDGENAKSVLVGKLHFMLTGSTLFGLNELRWRTPGTEKWTFTSQPCRFCMGNGDKFEISSPYDDDTWYLISKDGYEKIERVPVKEIIEDILKRVTVIERRGDSVFAMLKDRAIALGCLDVIKILHHQGMIKTIHDSKDRSLFEVSMSDEFSTLRMERYRKEIINIHERVMTPLSQ